MITVKITGGLGNQMFQFAFGRSLALRRGDKLCLDVSQYGDLVPGDTPRRFLLDRFLIDAEIKETSDVGTGTRILWKTLNKIGLLFRNDFHLRYYPYFAKSSLTYFDGFFQSYKYFEEFSGIIKQDLRLKGGIPSAAEKMAAQIKACNSVSVHIRRGDYISNASNFNSYGVCSPDYYYGAANLIEENVHEPVYFIFSDDITWVQENLKIDGQIVYVSQYGFEEATELFLMSQCKHNIIANSSFSWWGAWLNENPDKIVIAPKKWTNIKNFDTIDLIPSDWMQL